MPSPARRMRSRTPSNVTPFASARCELAWITGPSAIGSENGTPTSMTSAPASSSACSSSNERARSGWPAVTYTINARLLDARNAANRRSMADKSDEIVADTNAVAVGILRLDDRAKEHARLVALRQVHARARVRQIPHRVADDAQQRSREHFRQRI